MVISADLVAEAKRAEYGILVAFSIDAEMSGRLILMTMAVNSPLPNHIGL